MPMYYSPGCKIERDYPQASAKLTQLVMDRGFATELSGCCRKAPNREKVGVGGQICACVNCLGMLEEIAPDAEFASLWVAIDADEGFPLPSYGGRTLALQDCGRSFDRPEVHDAVRSLLAKMNVQVVELPDAREKTNFCGPAFLKPVPKIEASVAPKRYVETAGERGWFIEHSDEEIEQAMRKHCANIPTDEVVCYCTACATGLQMGGKQAYHLVELVTGCVPWTR